MLLLLLSLLTRFFFVGLSLEANGGFLLREMMGENVILRVILSSSLFFALWLILLEAWNMECKRPISVDSCSLQRVPS